MKVHGVAQHSGVFKMFEVKFAAHVGNQSILGNEDEFFINVLKRLNFVVHLNQDCFCRHFPIYAVSFFQIFSFVFSMDSKLL